MGLRLEGQPLSCNTEKDIVSSGLIQGSIQVPPSGLPIISSVDGQTIGGYPRIANVISSDLNILGQLKPGDKMSWLLVSRDKAWQHLQQKQAFLNKLLLS
jgi:allophanate hydrolase subunit 2